MLCKLITYWCRMFGYSYEYLPLRLVFDNTCAIYTLAMVKISSTRPTENFHVSRIVTRSQYFRVFSIKFIHTQNSRVSDFQGTPENSGEARHLHHERSSLSPRWPETSLKVTQISLNLRLVNGLFAVAEQKDV